jgi:hypothetical protein
LNDERYTLEETTVRFARSKLWLTLSFAPSLAMLAFGMKVGALLFLFPLPAAIGFLLKRTERARVVASNEGLRVGDLSLPRAALESALVRHDGPSTYVELRGKHDVEIEVANNVEADALVRALGLDAGRTTLDVRVDLAPNPFVAAAVLLALVGVAVALALVGQPAFAILSCFLAIAIVFTTGRASLRIGADGIALRRRWTAARFIPHDQIGSVDLDGTHLVVRETSGRETRFSVRGQGTLDDEGRAIARRIVQARQAHRASDAAPELSIALDRGAQTTREWLADLRKLGEGTVATFRTIGVAREQLFEVVESTAATAKDRVAALVALRSHLREEDKTRIRVLTERIAAPELRDNMVRVLDHEEDDELLEALEAVDRK